MDCMDSLSGPHIKTKQPSTLTLISVFGAILPREPHTQLKNVPNKDKAYFMNEPHLFQPPKKMYYPGHQDVHNNTHGHTYIDAHTHALGLATQSPGSPK